MINLIFDVDDTLYEQITPFKQAYQKLGYDQLDIDMLQLWKKVRSYGDEVFDQVNAGKMSVDESGVYRLTKGFKDFNYEISEKDALELQVTYRHNLDDIKMSKEMVNLLEELNEKQINIAILTNGPVDHQLRKIKNLGLDHYFDKKKIFISGDYDFSKPDARMFNEVINTLNFKKSDTYFVGDSYANDIVGASNADLKSIWINKKHEQVKEVIPTYTVEDERQVIALIRKLVKDER